MKTYKGNGDKVVGVLNDGGIYVSIRKGSIHILRILDAWGIDSHIVKDLTDEKCHTIQVYDKETDELYSISLQSFLDNCIEKNFVGDQMFCPRIYWMCEKK